MLRPGDRVAVTVWRNAELTGTFTVTRDSTLQHPIYSAVRVVGVPLQVVEERLRAVIRRYEAEPQFTVDPQFRVYVGGMVRNQNQQHLPEMSVGEAITLAGGSTAPDRRYRLRLVRDGQQRIIRMNDPDASAALREPIQSGDQILVEESPSFNRSYLQPAMQVLQIATGLISTYVLVEAVFGDDGDKSP